MSNTMIEPKLLMELVRKYNVELQQNPNDRRSHWVKIAEEYNGTKGTKFSYHSLSKKLANMKQRERQKFLAEKKRNMLPIEEEMKDMVDENVRIAVEDETMETLDDAVHQSDHLGHTDDSSSNESKPFRVIKVVQDKTSFVSAKLLSAKAVEMDLKSEEAESCTRQGYENLLRDLLTCLAKKYKIEEPCGSSQIKHEIWRQLTNEYLQLTGGLVNVSQREVMRKWTNMKFTCKARGIPHPLLRAEQLDIKEVAQKLKLCQQYVIGDEAMKPVETTKRLEAIKEKVKAKSIVEQTEREEKPPLKLLERQIMVETLRFEQERLAFMREKAKIEQDKLAKDVILADIEIEKARCELELTKHKYQL